MATLSRTKVLVVAIALLVGLAIWPHGSQAATGGTLKALSTATTATTTASSLTVDHAAPDGNTTAQCRIQRTSRTAGTSTQQCFTINYKTGPGADDYEVTSQGTSGTILETGDATNHGDVTLGAVFIEAPGQAAQPTNTPGGPTNTPLPPTATPTAAP